MAEEQTIIRPIAPEDVAVGDVVVITHRTDLVVPHCDAYTARAEIEPIRVRVMPDCAGWPYRVLAVCLPFLLVEEPEHDGVYNLDTRRLELARVSPGYYQAVADRRKDAAEASS